MVKHPVITAGDSRDMGSIPGLGKSPGEGNSNVLQDSCLGNNTDRGDWQVTDHGVTKKLDIVTKNKQTNKTMDTTGYIQSPE